MSVNRPNPRLAKIHRSYTVEEVAVLYGIHRNTVRTWIKRGLQTIDERRPVLILGSHLGEYLRGRRTVNKRTCAPGEIYCVRCREPRIPAANRVRYHPLTAAFGNLVGLCPCCGAGLYRRVTLAKLPLVLGVLSIAPPQAQEHIDESPQPSENSDSMQDAPDHANASP